MLIKGNPGTGKTFVARILGKIFSKLSYLSKGHLLEVERADLVGEYIGHTAQKTKEQINKALGGILFVDEAYSLARGGERDFGREAIDTLVKAMEDHKNDLVVILAGYRDEMEFFLTSNPGLDGRFPIKIEFSDYNSEELYQIAISMFNSRQYILEDKAKVFLEKIVGDKRLKKKMNFSNARIIRNLVEASLRRQAVRLLNNNEITKKDLLYICKRDLEDSFYN